jgi:hypothetical protein
LSSSLYFFVFVILARLRFLIDTNLFVVFSLVNAKKNCYKLSLKLVLIYFTSGLT